MLLLPSADGAPRCDGAALRLRAVVDPYCSSVAGWEAPWGEPDSADWARILTMPPRGFRGVHLGECLGSLGESPARPTGCSPRTSSHAATPPGRGAGSPSALSPAPQGLARPSRAAVTPCGPSSLRRRSLLAGVSWESWGHPVTGGKWRARTVGMVCGKAVRVHCGYFHDEAAAGRAAAAEAARQGVKAAREATRQRAEETRRRERKERAEVPGNTATSNRVRFDIEPECCGFHG
jgi:hypothetical protein